MAKGYKTYTNEKEDEQNSTLFIIPSLPYVFLSIIFFYRAWHSSATHLHIMNLLYVCSFRATSTMYVRRHCRNCIFMHGLRLRQLQGCQHLQNNKKSTISHAACLVQMCAERIVEQNILIYKMYRMSASLN